MSFYPLLFAFGASLGLVAMGIHIARENWYGVVISLSITAFNILLAWEAMAK